MTAKRTKLLRTALAERDEAAEPVVRQVHDRRAVEPDPLRGRFAGGGGGARRVVEEEIRRPSRRLFDQFARGEMILLLGRHPERTGKGSGACPGRATLDS